MKYHKQIIMFVSDVSYVWMTLYTMRVAATMVGMFYFLQKGKVGWRREKFLALLLKEKVCQSMSVE